MLVVAAVGSVLIGADDAACAETAWELAAIAAAAIASGAVAPLGVGVAAGTNNALNALGGVFGIAILAAIFAAHGSYATHATFIDGFRPAEWAAAGASAIGVIASALAPAKSATPGPVTLAPQPAPAGQPA